MSEIVVAEESARPTADMSVREAVRGHADPDAVAEVLAPPEGSVATEESADRTLDEFEDRRAAKR